MKSQSLLVLIEYTGKRLDEEISVEELKENINSFFRIHQSQYLGLNDITINMTVIDIKEKKWENL